MVVVLRGGKDGQKECSNEHKYSGSHDAASVAQFRVRGKDFVVFGCGSLFVNQISSVTGRARNPLEKGKLFGVRATTAPPVTKDLPTILSTKARFTESPMSGSSVHFASNNSRRPPVSTTKSTSRVRSRQKKRLPACPAVRSRARSWA